MARLGSRGESWKNADGFVEAVMVRQGTSRFGMVRFGSHGASSLGQLLLGLAVVDGKGVSRLGMAGTGSQGWSSFGASSYVIVRCGMAVLESRGRVRSGELGSGKAVEDSRVVVRRIMASWGIVRQVMSSFVQLWHWAVSPPNLINSKGKDEEKYK